MNTCVTRIVALCVAVSLGSAARAESLEPRAEATLGVRLYGTDKPFDDDDLTSYLDQYRYLRTKNADVAYFADIMHADIGLARDDDTYLVRLERWSPEWLNDRAELEVDWKGLDLDVDLYRFRNDELRVYPEGTSQIRFPTSLTILNIVYGSNFNAEIIDTFGVDERMWVRRTGVDGELRLRPEDFGIESGPLDEFRFYSRLEHRSGRRQDRFLLDTTELGVGGAATARFRASRRELDQDVTTVGGGLVLTPWDLFTSAFDIQFESFREDQDPILLSDLAAQDATLGTGLTGATGARAFQFVPDTNRWTGSVKLSRRIGEASLHGGASYTKLEQVHNAPLQRMLGLDRNELTTYSAHGAFDVPLCHGIGVNGFAKFVRRDNDMDTDSFASVSTDAQQVNAYFRRRREFTGGFELTATPARGSLLAAGYRGEQVHRRLRWGTAPGAIQPDFALIDDESEQHTTYLRARTRLLRALQLSAEAGYTWQPQVGLSREIESGWYVEQRGSYAFRKLPVALSWSGQIRDSRNDDIELISSVATIGAKQKKDLDRTQWDYSATVTAYPFQSTALFGSFFHSRNEEQFSYIRTSERRYAFNPLVADSLRFFLDSRPSYESDVKTLVVGANHAITESLDAAVSSSFTWSRAHFHDDATSAQVLEQVNQVRNRIMSLNGNLGYQLRPGLRFDFGYRFDAFRDDNELQVLSLDEDVHSITFKVTINLEDLLERR